MWRDWQDRLTPLPDREFESLNGERRLKAGFEVAALDGFGSFSRAELGACGALIGYVELTQKGRLPHLAPPRQVVPGSHMQIDAATRRNLELLSSLSGERRGSLIGAIDRTVTGAGGRLLAARLAAPLAQPEPIRRRLDAVQALVDQPPLREALQAPLKGCPDMERALSRLSLGRGGPRDLLALKLALARAATHQGDPGRERLAARAERRGHRRARGAARRASRRRSPTIRRCSPATAASSGRAGTRSSTSSAACAIRPAATSRRSSGGCRARPASTR